jgi:hypothetical protein
METYTVDNRTVCENGVVLPSVIEPKDVHILERAAREDRLEWQGYEALRDGAKWVIYLQSSTGLKRKKSVKTLSAAWIWVNGWS